MNSKGRPQLKKNQILLIFFLLCFNLSIYSVSTAETDNSFYQRVIKIDQSEHNDFNQLYIKLKKEITDNPYESVIPGEQDLWEEVYIALHITEAFDTIFKEVADLIDTNNLKLKLLKREPVHYSLMNIIYKYFQKKLDSLSSSSLSILPHLKDQNINKQMVIKRFYDKYKQNHPSFKTELLSVKDKWSKESETVILAEEMKKVFTRYSAAFTLIEEKEKEYFLKNLFFFCLFSLSDQVLNNFSPLEIIRARKTLLFENRLPDITMNTIFYNHLLLEGFDIKYPRPLTLVVYENFDKDYNFKKLLRDEPDKNFELKYYINYSIKPGFTKTLQFSQNLVNTFSTGLFTYFHKPLPFYEDLSISFNFNLSFNSLSYESIYENILYTNAIAWFNSYSVNFQTAVSFFKFHIKDILIFRPLCLYGGAGYVYFNQIDTRDYGNILLTEALQPIFLAGYFLDIEIKNHFNILFEINYRRYFTPVGADLNIPSYEIGPGLAFLFKII